jgi:cbb3-type cytochrome oxidase subunit 3
MKNTKGLVGLLAFIGCLWAVVVTTYGAQVKNEAFDGKQTTMLPMTDSSCSSSTSTSGSE